MRFSESHMLNRILQIFRFLLVIFACSSGTLPSVCSAIDAQTASNSGLPTKAQANTSAQQEQNATKNNGIIFDYQKHRQEFESKKNHITTEVEEERSGLQQQIHELKTEIADGKHHLNTAYNFQDFPLPPELDKELKHVNGIIAQYHSNAQSLIPLKSVALAGLSIIPLVAIIPWAISGGMSSINLLLAFAVSITTGNLYLFIRFRSPEIFLKYKKKLTLLLIVVLVASATMVFAEPVEKRVEVEAKIRQAENMLNLAGNQKAIIVLESRPTGKVFLPEKLVSGDPNLKISRELITDSPEYFISLAALYMSEKKNDKAIEILSSLAENRGVVSPPDGEIVISLVHFLVENGHSDIAGKAVTNHARYIQEPARQLELAEYLRKHDLQLSADHIMNLLLKNTSSISGLTILAQFFNETGKQDKTLELLTKALNQARILEEVIVLAEASLKLHAEAVFQKIPEKCKNITGTSAQFIQLAILFCKNGQSSIASFTLQQAATLADNPQALKEVIKAIIDNRQDSVMEHVRIKILHNINNIVTLPLNSEQFRKQFSFGLDFVDFLLNLNRKEDASKLFEAIIALIRQGREKNNEYMQFMTGCIQEAVQREFRQVATEMATELTFTKPRDKAYSTFVTVRDDFLRSLQGLPNRNKVAVPLLAGLINEDSNRISEAEQWYIQAVLLTLDRVNSSFGDYTPDSLNHFYLLGRLWEKENRTEVLAPLDRVYASLENKYLQGLKETVRRELLAKELNELATVQRELALQKETIEQRDKEFAPNRAAWEQKLQERIAEAKTELEEKKKTASLLPLRTFLNGLATVVILLVILGFLAGCIRLAWDYSQRMQEHRCYGFFSRFIEVHGWVHCFSLIGIPEGLFLIFFGQVQQIFQKMHELSLQRFHSQPYSPALPGHSPSHNDKAQEVSDAQ